MGTRRCGLPAKDTEAVAEVAYAEAINSMISGIMYEAGNGASVNIAPTGTLEASTPTNSFYVGNGVTFSAADFFAGTGAVATAGWYTDQPER